MENSTETKILRRISGSDYPMNLLDAIEIDGDCWQHEIPFDINGTIEYVNHTFLSAREADVLHQRFFHGKTCSEIGKMNGVTAERVRQIEARALRRLREPKHINYLRIGIAGVIRSSVNAAVEKAYSGELSRTIEMLEGVCENVNPLAKARKMNIVELGLSTRSFNCLGRAGMKTLGDVEKLTAKQLKHIRNLGTRCYDEIIEALKKHGIKLREDDI